MKRVIISFLSLIICVCIFVPKSQNFLVAGNACEVDPNSSECRIQKAKESQQKINDYKKEIEDAKKNADEANKLASDFFALSVETGKEIEALQAKIDDLQIRIDELATRISENEARVEELNNRVLNNMESSQGTMHFNPLLDFILGANGFADMLRRTYGVEAIMSKEANDRQELVETVRILEEDKKEISEDKQTLESTVLELQDKADEYNMLYNYYTEMEARASQLIDQLNDRMEEEKFSYKEALSFLNDVSSLEPVDHFYQTFADQRYFISGPFPKYYGGGIHLGVDYAISYGSAIYAPANGLVLMVHNGCGYGYVGCTCGGSGSWDGLIGGGNQLSMITSVDGHVFAILYCHLSNAAVSRYQVVLTGDVIGYGGSSGNSSGPHCHVELYYLGEGDWYDIQNDYLTRSYNSSFNTGWNDYAYNNTRCSVRNNMAPCRMDPRDWLYEK